MIYELRFETKDFTAHDRRDLIDWLQEQNHQNQPTAVQQALRAGGLPLSPSDLPVLFQIIEEEDLAVPHPRMLERSFVLIPLNDIASNFIEPHSNEKIGNIVMTDDSVKK